jgi:hypothetical protein
MKTIVFDIKALANDTLDQLDDEMVELLFQLMSNNNVAILSDYCWKQIQKPVISKLESCDSSALNNLYVLTSSGACMYQVWNKYGWVPVYQNKLERTDTEIITKTLEQLINSGRFEVPNKIWGKQIDVTESNISLAWIGQKAPQSERDNWDPDKRKRQSLIYTIKDILSEYELSISGKINVNISLNGINQKYGIDELMKKLHISKDDVVYLAADIVKGGYNYFAVEMGLDYIQVKDAEDVKQYIRTFLDSSSLVSKTG